MKTLVTGSSGFLGSTIVQDFNHLFGYVVAVSRSTPLISQAPQHYNGKFYMKDVCDVSFIELVQETSPSAIIHTAARSIVRDCEQNPGEAFRQNFVATVNVLEAARRLGTNIPVVVLETDKVYGQQPEYQIPTSEDEPLLGSTPYEYSKVMTANVCEFYRNYYGLKVYSLRPANLYGFRDNNKSRIIPNTFTKLLSNEQPVVFTDSKQQIREYVYVNDLVQIIRRLIVEEPKPGPYNISSGVVKSPLEVIKLISDVVGTDIKPKIVPKPYHFNEIAHQALKGTKLKQVFPDFKFTPMETALQEMYERIKQEGY